ncbi:Crp/Fnr family transcriptional regulator [Marinomonas mediterranea]|uniref:Transcriptional regulator, Crp/Fnr family n=1 Tax=Marinomonas mediterranea (strain ATCC 700492 / JCM 21426 / NBRC 103028 / MMB-1) TaxID=717774 RepID=F2K006_MARM1|nr:cyclic nucleotide-binding domain-containing protein [Marinomonas mediterranea]ADZ92118.1 transcriptional regulator, Crp/Fnr family [Marinomonas mediterranea MMB-1]WCN10084.1 cyclic nucleotide-binding domain-containing protein [Marinomonas mediterranea]WCN14128.1 cyclic nucleotide-binding domain-containing protein [Marinomonas mediterranea]WCN18183.1 cyclic nucleotide-binding domain-containing protein [Marinomonas mediterranea MMB-1]
MKRSDKALLRAQFITEHKLDTFLPTRAIESLVLFEFSANQQVFIQGQRLDYVYFLVEGKVLIDQIDAEGRQAVFAFESRAALIGEVELFNGEFGVSYCNAFTVEPTLLLGMPIEITKTYALNDPRFLRFVCTQLSEKLHRSSLFQPRAGNTAYEKVKRYLRSKVNSEGLHFKLENREELGNLLGISIRQLNRVIKQLVNEHTIKVKAKHLEVIDLKRLSPSSITRTEL